VSSPFPSFFNLSYGIFTIRYLVQNLDWLDEQLGSYDNDYLLIDLPGQIELYTHHSHILPPLLHHLRTNLGFSLCATYLLESQFILQPGKFFAGALSAMSAMIMLECAHLNVLSKVDLVKGEVARGRLKQFLRGDTSVFDPNAGIVMEEGDIEGQGKEVEGSGKGKGLSRFARLNEAIVRLVEDFGMVEFLPLDVSDHESVETILSYIDDCTQWAEDQVNNPLKENINIRNRRSRRSMNRILVMIIERGIGIQRDYDSQLFIYSLLRRRGTERFDEGSYRPFTGVGQSNSKCLHLTLKVVGTRRRRWIR
jgi:GPN-loop GTPase